MLFIEWNIRVWLAFGFRMVLDWVEWAWEGGILSISAFMFQEWIDFGSQGVRCVV